MSYNRIWTILASKGFVEECPTMDYDSGNTFHWYYKYPFRVRIAFIKHPVVAGVTIEVSSFRVDKQYIYGYRLGEYRIKRT